MNNTPQGQPPLEPMYTDEVLDRLAGDRGGLPSRYDNIRYRMGVIRDEYEAQLAEARQENERLKTEIVGWSQHVRDLQSLLKSLTEGNSNE